MALKGDIIAVGIAGVVLLAAGWYAKKKVGAVVDDAKKLAAQAAPYVNPMDPRNLAYSGVNAAGAAITGDSGFTLGIAAYDFLHPQWLIDITNPGIAKNGQPVTMGPLPGDFGITNPSEGW